MEDFVKRSIDRIQLASEMSLSNYGKPLVCEYSGGKDSDVQLWLFKHANVPFEVHHSHTSVDAPPVVMHIKEVFKELELCGIKCSIDYHEQEDGTRLTMWNLIPRKLFPPTRVVRYCCSDLKEGGNANRMISTGVRWAESKKRSGRSEFEVLAKTQKKSIGVSYEKMLITDNDERRMLFESCKMKAKTVVNPIIDWTDNNVWDFIHGEKVIVCVMYSWGYERLGCLGCPLARKCQREREMYDFPTYKKAYINAFDKMLEMREKKGKERRWTCGEEVYLWWMESDDVAGQISMDDYLAEQEE